MVATTSMRWAADRSDLRFPASGLLIEFDGSEQVGALGYRSCDEGCELWHEVYGPAVDWQQLVERVTAQARKAKYRGAVVATFEPLPLELEQELTAAGFAGQPLARPLISNAPDDLQPYLDWKGRVT